MPTSTSGKSSNRVKERSRSRGFTLIEILVVIIILGLLASVAVFSLGGSTQRRELDQHARDLLLVLQVAGERAILDNAEIGVGIADNRVSFMRYTPAEQAWSLLNERPFRERTWASDFAIELETEDDPPRMPTSEDAVERPDLVFFSSGETTPFRVTMSLETDPDRAYHIETDGLNPLSFREPGDDVEVRLQ